MDETKNWKCAKCDRVLKNKKNVFSYLGYTFSHEVMCCPECGKVLIPKALANGRIAEVEEQLEDK